MFRNSYFKEVYRDEATPDFCKWYFKRMLERAKHIVSKREFEHLNSETDTILFMHVCFDEAINPHEYSKEEFEEFSKYPTAENIFRMRDEFLLDEPDSLTWSEYFALHAITEISYAIFVERHFKNFNTEKLDINIDQAISLCAIATMEYLQYAERLASESAVTADIERITSDKTREKISLRNRNAAYKRHEPVRKLKDEFLAYYIKSDHPSRSEAARRFYNGLPDEKKRLLTPTNAVRTLTESLAKQLKP